MGKRVSITVTTNNPPGRDCNEAKITYTLDVNNSPQAPERGMITQPTCVLPTGSVVLNGLPDEGSWTITRSPGGSQITGTGTATTISLLDPGKYSFTVTNSTGCVSVSSAEVNINSSPVIPAMKITDPLPVCFPSTVDITTSSVTMGSDQGLIFTYWLNSDATLSYTSPSAAGEGSFYIKGTSPSTGCSDVKPVKVTVRPKPVARAGPDKILDNIFETNLEALTPDSDETGEWSVLSGSGLFSDNDNANTAVSDLSPGRNIFVWALSNNVCPPSFDSVIVMVNVRDPVFPSLITPNMDGKNDYFVVNWNEKLGKTELVVFDRSGIQVYENMNYDNSWNGVDYNDDPLPDGTYFYIMKSDFGNAFSGFIVIKR
jgi:gliding motility-associated-like protein